MQKTRNNKKQNGFTHEYVTEQKRGCSQKHIHFFHCVLVSGCALQLILSNVCGNNSKLDDQTGRISSENILFFESPRRAFSIQVLSFSSSGEERPRKVINQPQFTHAAHLGSEVFAKSLANKKLILFSVRNLKGIQFRLF